MAMEYFPCYDSYLEKTRKLSDQELGRLFRALMYYHSTGERQELAGRESMAFEFIADDIDRAGKAYEEKCHKAKKSAEKRYTDSTNACERMHSHTDEYESCQTKTKSKTKYKTNDISSDISAPAPEKQQKHKHGEYGNVLLTDEELQKLKAQFPDYLARIDRLSGYIASTGKSYKSHYATILNWARRDGEQNQKPVKPGDIHGCGALGDAELEAIRKTLEEPAFDVPWEV